jgi:hypothetical protein
MDYIGRSFTYMFQDKDWVQKILIGAVFGLLSLVVIGIPFVLGYLLQVARQASQGKELPLPAWDDLGEKFVSGLLFIIIGVIYSVPLAIVYIVLLLIPCLGWLAMIFLAISVAIIVPYVAVRFARSGNIGDAFDISGMWTFLQRNFGNLVLVWLMSVVLHIIAWFGLLALIVGVLFTMFWAELAIFYLYGRVVYEAERVQSPGVPTSGGAGAI